MLIRFAAGAAATLAIAGASVGAVALAGSGGSADNIQTASAKASKAKGKPIQLADSRLFIEINGTDGDAGLQMFLDGEPWKSITIRDPRGRVIMDTENRGRLEGWGLTSLFFESAEPAFDEVPFAKFKQRFPEGRYTFRGDTIDGTRLVGVDRLSHRVPARPVVTFPTENALVDPNALVITWAPVTSPAGIVIDGYQVIVTNETNDGDIEIDLPATASQASIPPEFMNATDEFKVEVIARAQSGNQTITEIPFRVS